MRCDAAHGGSGRARLNPEGAQPAPRLCSAVLEPAQLWRISVPSTFRHSRMKAASAVQPLADTIVPSMPKSTPDMMQM